MKTEIDMSASIASAKEKRVLNKPFRTPGGPKKFAVYVKNDKGNVVKVSFGDPNMEIKRDDPNRRKSYRARHHCETPGPKWKANYWSCKMWSAKPVSKITSKSSFSPQNEHTDEATKTLNQLSDYYYEKQVYHDPHEDWDGYSFYSHDDILKAMPELANAEPTYEDNIVLNESGKEYPYDAKANPERVREQENKPEIKILNK